MGMVFEGCAALVCTVPAIPALADAADDDTAEA